MIKKNSITGVLDRKKGSLTTEQIAVGLHFCYSNALDLLEDARILLKNRKIARAFGLCVLCLEELAKIPLLSNGIFLQGKDGTVWSKFWKAFCSHKLKQNIWSIYGQGQLLSAAGRREKYYKHLYSPALPSLEKMKQLSFYVAYLNDGTAMKPDIFFEHMKGLVGLVLKMAEDRLEAFRPLHSTLDRSKKVVALMSHVKIQGLSDQEVTEKLFHSINSIKSYRGREKSR
jgi:AbiV family abortive infection protein